MVGTVVSVKMDKTAVVAVERRYPHPLYHKIIRSTKRYKAHDPNNAAVLGDVVKIVESRPISKEKRWRIMETMTRGNVADLQPREIGMPEEAVQVRQAPPPPMSAQMPDEAPVTADVADEVPVTPESPVADVAYETPVTPESPVLADEVPVTSESPVLAAASDDMDASADSSTQAAPMLEADEPAVEAENVIPDVTVPARRRAASTPAEAASDEAPLTSDSEVLAAASDDMDVKDYEADVVEEDKA